MVPSKRKRCHSVAADIWRFPLDLGLHAHSLLLSILPALPGILGLQEGRIFSIQSLFAGWSSLHGFGSVSLETPGPPVWGRLCRVLWVHTPGGAVGQAWALWTWQAGAGVAPSVGTHAVLPHYKRNTFAVLMAAACTIQISSYLSNSGAFPKSAVAHPMPFPALLLALLVLSVSLLFV